MDGTAAPPTSAQHLYLVRLSHTHESFRLPELRSLATYLNIPLTIHEYDPSSPFCIISLPDSTSSPSTSSTGPDPDPDPDPDATDHTHDLARTLLSRSILSKSIYQLYAAAPTYPALHARVRALPASTWTPFAHVSFRFGVDAFRGKRSMADQRRIVDEFAYLPFKGPIAMSGAQERFVVFEEWPALVTAEDHRVVREGAGGGAAGHVSVKGDVVVGGGGGGGGESTISSTGFVDIPMPVPADGNDGTQPDSAAERKPKRLYFGRYLGGTQRELAEKHDLKRRPYISTTSMDAELALVTALLAHAGPGKLILDPFVGTGGFMVAAGELGAVTFGSDIDGRSFRGKGAGMEKGVLANFKKYGILERFGDCVTADLTHTPFRLPVSRRRDGNQCGGARARWLDGVICDPPYGVREGLKVLGRRHHDGPSESGRVIHEGPYFVDGVPSHTLPGFIAPKRPYSFDRMLEDILDFAARILVDGGRLAFWMPSANEAEEEFGIPRHPSLELKHVCVQGFNKWSRRLLVYERLAGDTQDVEGLPEGTEVLSAASAQGNGHHADDLNQFRRMYFRGFNGTLTPKNDKG